MTDYKNQATTSKTGDGANESLASSKPDQTADSVPSEPVKEVKATKVDKKKKTKTS